MVDSEIYWRVDVCAAVSRLRSSLLLWERKGISVLHREGEAVVPLRYVCLRSPTVNIGVGEGVPRPLDRI